MLTGAQDRQDKHGHGKVINIRICNPAHFTDSLAFASAEGKSQEFLARLMEVCAMFRHEALGTKPETVTVDLRPDSRGAPSFVFHGYLQKDIPGSKPQSIMHGGLIYHRDSKTWSIHT
jgi:hypothetical protein